MTRCWPCVVVTMCCRLLAVTTAAHAELAGPPQRILKQARAGTLPARVLAELFHYYGGRPPSKPVLPPPDPTRGAEDAELRARMRRLTKQELRPTRDWRVADDLFADSSAPDRGRATSGLLPQPSRLDPPWSPAEWHTGKPVDGPRNGRA